MVKRGKVCVHAHTKGKAIPIQAWTCP